MCHGIHLSMHFQKALVKTGMSILERHLVKSLRSYRYAILSSSGGASTSKEAGGLVGSGEFSVFSRSVPHLERLAKFVANAYKSAGQKDLPLVIAALSEADEMYLVVGISGGSRLGDVRKK